jgi:hypothetical protein
MDARRAGADHPLHQLMGVEHAAETGFGIADDGQEVVDEILMARPDAASALNFVGALEGVVDALDHRRHRVDRIQRLVGIHRHVGIVVGGDLPAGQIDGLDAGLGLLHGLTAGQRAQAVDIGFGVNQVPQLLGAPLRQAVFNRHVAAQPHHIFGGVAALDAVIPAGILGPCRYLFSVAFSIQRFPI